GIGQKAFEVCLRQCREIAVEQGGGRQKNDRRDQFISDTREALKRLYDPQKHDKSDRFRTNREKCRNRRRSTLVDIGNPELEWGSCNLEPETDKDEEPAKQETWVIVQRNGWQNL